MIFKVSHLFNIIFVLPLIYLLVRAFQHLYLDFKGKKPKVDFDDLVKQKEQLLLLTLGTTLSNENCKTLTAYTKLEDSKILEIFKGLQWGEGPFQREVISKLKKDFDTNCDFFLVTNSLKFLIKNEILLAFEELPQYPKITYLTSIVSLYKNMTNSESLKKALLFQINGDVDKELSVKEFDAALKKLITSDKDILKELNLYLKVIERVKEVPPLKSKTDLKGALKIMGLKENSSKTDIKKRYRDLALAQHPDTFIDLDIPDDLLKQAGENFNRINSAYQLLLKNLS